MTVSDDPQTRQSVTTDEIRDDLDAILRRAARGKERLVIRRRKRAVAAIVPLEDVEYLDKIEDARSLPLPQGQARMDPRRAQDGSMGKGQAQRRNVTTYSALPHRRHARRTAPVALIGARCPGPHHGRD
jgi:antitoxin (DNA-binding transcriptional repressor) of toxin-antitoxin stability system